jgi:geranylgeranyl diphosphate synthase type II
MPRGFKAQVDEHLSRLLKSAIARAHPIDPGYAELLGVVRDQALGSGKRLRPYIMLTAYEGCGGSEREPALQAAISQELFHNFLLIHDDIIDRDTIRHGRPNVLGVYHRRFVEQGLESDEAWHQASSFALLAGNATMALGLEAILTAPFPAERKLAAAAHVQRMLFEEMGGQLADVAAALPTISPPALETLLRVCRYKTACYSFEVPLLVGAELAGATKSTQRELAIFGQALGVAFQLTDDLLGVFGREEALGKPVLSDLQEGKRTVLIHFALAAATSAQKRELGLLWGHRNAGTAELEAVRELLRATGAPQKTQELAESFLKTSLQALSKAGLGRDARSRLTELANFCIQRQF